VWPRVEQRLVALLRLEPGDDADDLRAGLHAVGLAQVAVRLHGVVAGEVDAVVDEPDRREAWPLVGDLRDDRIRDGDQLVDLRREAAQRLAVRGGPDAGRMDRRHEVRPRAARVPHREHGLRPDHVGAVHVGVDDVRPDRSEMGRQRGHGGRVVGLLDQRHREPGTLQLPDGAAGGQRDDARLEPRGVEPGHQPEHVLLRSAARAGREDLDDTNPAGRARPAAVDRRQAGVPGDRTRHQPLPLVASRRTRIRWIGSSIAPHSYL
jgi:hypothetical protein